MQKNGKRGEGERSEPLQLSELDMSLNTKKSVCIRFGPRFQTACCSLTRSQAVARIADRTAKNPSGHMT